MKVGILSESPADAAAIKILAEAVLRRRIDLVGSNRLRAGGWASVVQVAAIELKHLYYQTDAEGLIVVVDTDDTPVHDNSHSTQPILNCRMCQIEASLLRAQSSLNQPGRNKIRFAVGLPVPAIEAWYRCGNDPHAAEDRFIRELRSGNRLTAARQQLKRDVYGTDRPSLVQETTMAIKEATRLATDIERLRAQFPRGFGGFYEALATWR